ncbi:MAG: carboxypeptidase-like regulatory domain-containing protein, partial [Longimicrobiales bacterium]
MRRSPLRPSGRFARSLAGGLLGFLMLAPGATAQARQPIRGTVSVEGTRRPVGGAFVSVLDGAGERVAGGLSRDDGTFLVHVPRSGAYRIRAERIGFRSTESVEIRVPEGEIVDVAVVAPAQAVVIEGMDVEGGRRCDLRPESGRATLALWEEARKALDVALWTDDDGRFVYELESWTRRYDRSGRRLLNERVDRRTHVGRHAFRSVSPENLAQHGFVQGSNAEGRFYFAPDAGVMLSDAFLGTHCFEAVRVDGRLGLEFSPV